MLFPKIIIRTLQFFLLYRVWILISSATYAVWAAKYMQQATGTVLNFKNQSWSICSKGMYVINCSTHNCSNCSTLYVFYNSKQIRKIGFGCSQIKKNIKSKTYWVRAQRKTNELIRGLQHMPCQNRKKNNVTKLLSYVSKNRTNSNNLIALWKVGW